MTPGTQNTHAGLATRAVRLPIAQIFRAAGLGGPMFGPATTAARRTAANRPTETSGAMFHAKHPGSTGKRRRRRQRGKRSA